MRELHLERTARYGGPSTRGIALVAAAAAHDAGSVRVLDCTALSKTYRMGEVDVARSTAWISGCMRESRSC